MASNSHNASAEKRYEKETTPPLRSGRLPKSLAAERIKSSPMGTYAQVVPPLLAVRAKKEVRQW